MLETVRAVLDSILVFVTAATVAFDWPQIAAMAAFAYWMLRIVETTSIQKLIKNERICKVIQAIGLLAIEQAVVRLLERFGLSKSEVENKIDELDNDK